LKLQNYTSGVQIPSGFMSFVRTLIYSADLFRIEQLLEVTSFTFGQPCYKSRLKAEIDTENK